MIDHRINMIKPLEINSSILHFNNLENQIWHEISLQSDYRLVKDRIKKQSKAEGLAMSDTYADQKAKDIQYCIRQAKEYFLSSKTATLVIKPTLIYYGLISLAAALVILKSRDRSLNSMKGAHGLKDKYPANVSATGKTTIRRNDILNISAEFQENGTFIDIINLELFEGFTLPIKHEKRPDTSKDFKQPSIFKTEHSNLREISLLALLQNVPEIWKETKLILKVESLVYKGEAVLDRENIICRISKELNNIDEIKRNFQFAQKAIVSESNDFYFLSSLKSQYTETTPLTKRDAVGLQYLTADNNNQLITNDFIIYYLTFFILGSLARYKPALWRYILDDQMQGLGTIPETLCESAYTKLPHYFLNEFTSTFYKI